MVADSKSSTSSSSSSGSSSSKVSSLSSAGSSSGSSLDGDGLDAPAPLAPEDGVHHAGHHGRRNMSNMVVHLPMGVMRYYDKADKQYLTMECGHHDNCKLSRSCQAQTGNARKDREGQGRPIGLLLAWAEVATDFQGGHAHVHMKPLPDWEQRREARERAHALPEMDAIFALGLERDLRPGESEEPETIP